MATKTKKQQPVTAPVKAKPAVLKKEPFISTGDIIPMSLVFLYLFVDFVPPLEGADVMGAQWVYVVIINMLSAVFLFIDKKNSGLATAAVGKNLLSVLFIALFVMGGLSIFFALNKVEGFVTYARFAATFVSYFIMAAMLFNRPSIFKIIAQILSVFMLIESINILQQFFSGIEKSTLGEVIYNLKGNSGNKNIMAASLVIKIPFVAYCIYSSKLLGKIINLVILAMGALAVFFINARASYIGLILITVIFIAYCVYEYMKNKDLKEVGTRLGFYFLPLVFAFVLSSIIINNQLQFETADTSFGYGSVTERLSSISFTKEGSNMRMNQWMSAVDYIKHHPIMGAGFGNWKLASIPYERTFSDEMFITYHVHNDFLETTAELGLLGGLLYLSLYLCLAFFTFKVVFSNASPYHKQMAVFSLMGLAVYFTDAMFNFPLERPVMQIFLAFILAVNVNAYLMSRRVEVERKTTGNLSRIVMASVALVLMIPAYYVTHETYKSMIAQNKYNQDMLSAAPVYRAAVVNSSFPDIPNLNVFGFPIDAIKARYLLVDKKYDEALAMLNKSVNVNPYITYNEFLKANIFLESGKRDSAIFYGKKCFYMKPRAKSNYLVYLAALSGTKDTTAVTNAYNEALKFRQEPWIYSEYINAMYNQGKDYKFLYNIAQTGIQKFPNDPDLQKKFKELSAVQNVPR